ncbi:MAG: hypothetical protein QOH64_1147, partial [Acidimicrobiaceae bacterium]
MSVDGTQRIASVQCRPLACARLGS